MEALRRIRKMRGLTMKQLGEMTGVTESAIGQYETGKRNPSFDMLLKLAEALDCHISALMVPDDALEETKSPSQEDELAKELQILRDRPDLRALLHAGARTNPESVRKLAELMETMQED